MLLVLSCGQIAREEVSESHMRIEVREKKEREEEMIAKLLGIASTNKANLSVGRTLFRSHSGSPFSCGCVS